MRINQMSYRQRDYTELLEGKTEGENEQKGKFYLCEIFCFDLKLWNLFEISIFARMKEITKKKKKSGGDQTELPSPNQLCNVRHIFSHRIIE